MRNNILLLLLSCLVIFSPQFVVAQEQEQTPPQNANLQQRLQFYKKKGFSVRGPLQVTKEPGAGKVGFYRHENAEYDNIRIIDEKGRESSVEKLDKVYLLQRNKDIILMNIKSEVKGDV